MLSNEILTGLAKVAKQVDSEITEIENLPFEEKSLSTTMQLDKLSALYDEIVEIFEREKSANPFSTERLEKIQREHGFTY